MWRDRYAPSPQPLRTFYLSRFLRLVPVFVLVNAFALLVWTQAGRPTDISFHGSISNLFILGYGSLPAPALAPAWSLDVEMQFYLVAPFLVPLVLCWPLPSLALATLATLGSFTLSGFDFTVGLGLMPSYLLFFGLGMAAALKSWQISPRLARLSLAVGVTVLWGLLLSDAYGPSVNLLAALAFTPFALSTVQNASSRTDAMFGDMSYVLYLLHWPAVVILGDHGGSLPMAERLPYVAATVLLTLAATWAVWRFFDRPLNRWRSVLIERRLASA